MLPFWVASENWHGHLLWILMVHSHRWRSLCRGCSLHVHLLSFTPPTSYVILQYHHCCLSPWAPAVWYLSLRKDLRCLHILFERSSRTILAACSGASVSIYTWILLMGQESCLGRGCWGSQDLELMCFCICSPKPCNGQIHAMRNKQTHSNIIHYSEKDNKCHKLLCSRWKKRMNILGKEFICVCEWAYIYICICVYVL